MGDRKTQKWATRRLLLYAVPGIGYVLAVLALCLLVFLVVLGYVGDSRLQEARERIERLTPKHGRTVRPIGTEVDAGRRLAAAAAMAWLEGESGSELRVPETAGLRAVGRAIPVDAAHALLEYRQKHRVLRLLLQPFYGECVGSSDGSENVFAGEEVRPLVETLVRGAGPLFYRIRWLELAQQASPEQSITGEGVIALLNCGQAYAGAPATYVLGTTNSVFDAFALLEETLGRAELEPQVLSALARCLAIAEAWTSPRSTLWSIARDWAGPHGLSSSQERIEQLTKALSSPVESRWARRVWWERRLPGVGKMRLAKEIRAIAEALRVLKRPLREQLTWATELSRDWRPPWMQAELAGIVTTRVHVVARLRVGAAAVAAERYRLRHGSWPESVAELVPAYLDAEPQDPFSGGPVSYRSTPTGMVIYSIGGDLTDNGGASGTDGDITFTLIDPLRRGRLE
ncbi:MAG: hypothetical protein R6V05_10340 [Candidatus Brocadiia bacterium]